MQRTSRNNKIVTFCGDLYNYFYDVKWRVEQVEGLVASDLLILNNFSASGTTIALVKIFASTFCSTWEAELTEAF